MVTSLEDHRRIDHESSDLMKKMTRADWYCNPSSWIVLQSVVSIRKNELL